MQRMFACHANMILLDIVIIEYFFYNWTLLQLNIMIIDILLIAGIPPQMFSSHSRHFYYRTFCAFIGERRSEVLILTKERSDRAQDQEEDGGGGSLKEVLRTREREGTTDACELQAFLLQETNQDCAKSAFCFS